MILVKHYQSVNGNTKERKYRNIMQFDSMVELEKERRRLERLHKAQIDFTPVIDTEDKIPSEEILQTLFK